ncbi:hypothetical protein ACFQ1U_00290, partial [Tenacibaculum geojense]
MKLSLPIPALIIAEAVVSNMTKTILEHIMQLIIVLPILLFTMKSRKLENLKILLIFSMFFLLRSFLLYLPLEFSELKFINGNWNWTGKI